MKRYKKNVFWITLALIIAMLSSLSCATVVCTAATSVNSENANEIAWVSKADPDSVKTLTNGINIMTYKSYDTDNILFLKFNAIADYENVANVKLCVYSYWDKTSTEPVVYSLNDEWSALTLTYNNMPNGLSEISRGLEDAFSNTNRWRRIDITDYVRNNGGSELLFAVRFIRTMDENSGETSTVLASDKLPKIEVIYDEAPTVSSQIISGNAAENFNLTVNYDYSATYFGEGDTLIEWLCSDDENGTNETVIKTAGADDKTLALTDENVGKYIRAKITPFTNAGKYANGGADSFYTDYIGPVKSIQYLDELTQGLDYNVDTSNLYGQLLEKESYFNIGLSEIDSFDDSKKQQILANISSAAPQKYNELIEAFYKETATVKIEMASESDIASLIEDEKLALNLDEYKSITEKEYVYSMLSGVTFSGYYELQNQIDRAVAFANIQSNKIPANLYTALKNNSALFTADINSYSIGELLYACEYIIAADKTGINDFETADLLVSEALLYGKTNYKGGFITKKLGFDGEAYINTDYSNDIYGTNTVLPVTTYYQIYGNKNASNYKRYAFLSFDLTKLLNYELYSAKMNIYGTVGGGADKQIDVAETCAFIDSEDLVKNYPRGADIPIGEIISKCKFSYGTTKWNHMDITEYLRKKIDEGEKTVYLIFNYVDFVDGWNVANSGRIYSKSLGGEFAPYIELVYETPPLVKNIKISGTVSVGSTLTAEYDYYGCNDESGTIFEWYAADKDDDNFINISRIPGATEKSMLVNETYAGKNIMVKIKPCTAGGSYREGDYAESSYTVKVLDAIQSSSLITEINSILTSEDMYSFLISAGNASVLDIDAADNMSVLSPEGKTKVLQTLADKSFIKLEEFRDYYKKMIGTQLLNETPQEKIDELLNATELGLKLERYNEFADKGDIISALFNKNFQSVEAMQKAYNEACAIKEFRGVNHSNVKELLLWYDFMFDEDISEYKETELELICNMFMTTIQNNKESFSSIQSAFTTAVANAKNYTPGTEVSTSKSSGGGRNTTVSVPPSTNTQNITPVDKVHVFNDIDSVADWAEPQIEFLYEKGIISGDGKGLFRPNDNLTREEFVKMLVMAFNIEGDGKIEFDDVNEGDWFYKYVNKAVAAGIVNGISTSTFGTGEKITREDMCAMLYRAMQNKFSIDESADDLKYDDKDTISEYASNSIGVLSKIGIINGVGQNRFAPKNTATRAMAAVVISNALNK